MYAIRDAGSGPPSFDPPTRLETDQFVVRPLTIADAEQDYTAVVDSRDRVEGIFGPSSEWPPADLTLAQNRVDVAWHHKEFQRRDAFTYTVVDPKDTVEFGCCYIQPTKHSAYDAAVYFWVSDSGVDNDLAGPIETWLRAWITTRWPFEGVAYPGRDIQWSDWELQLE